MFSLIEKIIRLAGWSPVGKRVKLIVSESRDGTDLGTTYFGVVTQKLNWPVGGVNQPDAIMIHLDFAIDYMQTEFEYLLAAPRHTGYGIYALALTGIAAYILPIGNPSLLETNPPKDVLAIWDLALA